jgi:poly-gamma-glutamate capsule biosynthesis protein CapA/YwtB (metallophosphatase superfamily)
MNNAIHVLFGGDVMLGRLVKEAILLHGTDYPMGQISSLMRQNDLTIVNLECAITNNLSVWSGTRKAFYFGAPPQSAQILANCGVKLVSLANNHSLDYEVQGLLDTLDYLTQQHISFAGAGKNKKEAYAPAYRQVNEQKFGMVAFCDHQEDFAAGENTPGIAYLDLSEEATSIKQFELSLHEMKKEKIDWPLLSLHWGPNMVNRPSKQFIRLAHTAIEMGYKLIFGHSAHVFHGIEFYQDCPIIYAAGDLVDDYYVDPQFKNDHQLLFELIILENRVQQIILHPVFIGYCRTAPANQQQFDFIAYRAKKLCREFGVTVEQKGNSLIILH